MLALFPCLDLKAVTVFCEVRTSVLSKVFPGHFRQDTVYTGHQISLTGAVYCTPHSTLLPKNKASILILVLRPSPPPGWGRVPVSQKSSFTSCQDQPGFLCNKFKSPISFFPGDTTTHFLLELPPPWWHFKGHFQGTLQWVLYMPFCFSLDLGD